MSTKSNKKKMFKLITGILIPIFVMVASIVMVGVSYAWFSTSVTTEVASIDMSIEDAFTLSFDFGDNPTEMYEGQLAYVTKNTVTHLVTDEYATNVLGYTNPSTVYDGYMLDKPYTVGANVILDTQGKRVDFEVYINSVNIYMEDDSGGGNPVITNLMNLSNTNAINLIPYGFTWYLLDAANNKIYTPYGTTTEGNDLAVSGTTVTEKWFSTPSARTITNFTSTSESSMKIYVVFCPEKLYWLQYSLGKTYDATADWRAGMDNIYSANEKNMIYHLDSYGNTTAPYNPTSNPDLTGFTYWDPKYVGAKFEFNFTVNVLHIYEE